VRGPQQSIEFAQLAALPFPADPFPFGLAPLSSPMKQMEACCLGFAVALI